MLCYTTAASLSLYPSLSPLHWRGSMKWWRMCWRKLVKMSINGLFVLSWKWWTFCWDNSLVSPSTHVFCACGIVGTVLRITRRRTGLCGRNWCLAKKGTSSTTLWWTETEYSSHHLIKQFTEALDKDSDCFTYLCQVFPGLTMEKLKAGIFDGPQIRQLIRDPEFEKLNEKSGTGSLEGICSGSEELSWQQ